MAQSPIPPVSGTHTVQPTPFLKWVGGKTRLLAQLDDLFPADFGHYHEPFVGGGAVFFHLGPPTATLSDINGRLIETYRAVRDDVDGLIERLDHHRRRHNRAYYYQSRSRLNAPRGLDSIDRAALFMYLNKTCFNGLYRENRSGEFNVPMGRYKDPSLYDESRLRAASRRLQQVDLRIDGFKNVLDRAEEGDFVYFDPPYVPLNATSSFTGYAKGGFDADMQVQLAQTFDALAKRGVFVMMSNSNAPLVHELYAGWRIEKVMAPRSINSRSDKRGAIAEVVVRSW